MKNFELPLHLLANEGGKNPKLDALIQAHLIYTGLEEDEYHDQAPDIQVLKAKQFFTELGKQTWEERREQININRQAEQLPKCLDIPLAFATGGDIERARWLVEDMIDQGILHEPSSDHQEFFEQAGIQEEAFEQIAEVEAEKQREEVMRNLRRDN